MGERTHNVPTSEFALTMNAYYRHLLKEKGWDASGRRMEREVPANGPRRTVWEKFYKDRQAMTTNDIATLAAVFGMTPYDLVEKARKWRDEGGGSAPVTPIRPNVGPHPEDYEISEYPDALPAAAEEERKPGE